MSIFGKEFSDIDEIPIGGQRLYFPNVGRFRVKIDMLKALSASDSFHGEAAFIANLVVVESSVKELMPGSTPCWVQKIKAKTKRAAWMTIKEFFAAALNDPKLESLGEGGLEKHLEQACSEANPYNGVPLDLVTQEKRKLIDGETKIFTQHFWKPHMSLGKIVVTS